MSVDLNLSGQDSVIYNEFLRYLHDTTGISAVERALMNKYELIFKPTEVLPKVQQEITTLKGQINTEVESTFAKIISDSEKDPKLKALPIKDKLSFVGQIVVPKINAAAAMIRSKYPGAIEYLLESDVSALQAVNNTGRQLPKLGGLKLSGRKKLPPLPKSRKAR